jgi:hydrogenase-4 component B
MDIVVLADDAFSFLVAWEFMSLTSWALVIAHHREADNVRAGYVYLLMAGFGTLALLLAFGVLAGGSGHYDSVAWQALVQRAPHLYITASIALIFKAIIIPFVLHRIIVRLGIHRESACALSPRRAMPMC